MENIAEQIDNAVSTAIHQMMDIDLEVDNLEETLDALAHDDKYIYQSHQTHDGTIEAITVFTSSPASCQKVIIF